MLAPTEIEERIEQHKREFSEFAGEIHWIHSDVVSHHYLTAYKEPPYGFHHTCHAFMMLTFAWVDAMSAFWAGGRKHRNPNGAVAHHEWTDQTERMVAFLDAYYAQQTDINRVVVEMWRHTLMHEGKPREIKDRAGQYYSWSLLWEMNASRHYTIIPALPPDTGKPHTLYIIQIGLLPLIDDLGRAFRSYWHDLRSTLSMQQAYSSREAEIPTRTFIS